jgi:hypothetical protein
MGLGKGRHGRQPLPSFGQNFLHKPGFPPQ